MFRAGEAVVEGLGVSESEGEMLAVDDRLGVIEGVGDSLGEEERLGVVEGVGETLGEDEKLGVMEGVGELLAVALAPSALARKVMPVLPAEAVTVEEKETRIV